jgi:hypothetical protein
LTEVDWYQYEDKVMCHHGWLALKETPHASVKFCQKRECYKEIALMYWRARAHAGEWYGGQFSGSDTDRACPANFLLDWDLPRIREQLHPLLQEELELSASFGVLPPSPQSTMHVATTTTDTDTITALPITTTDDTGSGGGLTAVCRCWW